MRAVKTHPYGDVTLVSKIIRAQRSRQFIGSSGHDVFGVGPDLTQVSQFFDRGGLNNEVIEKTGVSRTKRRVEGDYELRLKGYASDGTLEETGDYYYLSVRKK